MARVRSGELPWTRIDDLHRMILDDILGKFGIRGLSPAEIFEFNRVWHRLRPWPDARRGLRRLKKRFVIGTLSNGNIGLLVNMAKHGGLPWDVVFSAEVFRHYKPDPETYLGAADLLGIAPAELMLVAAHKDDLFAAKACGLRTAFVRRPLEHGPAKRKDLKADPAFDFNVGDFTQLADRLCGRAGRKKGYSGMADIRIVNVEALGKPLGQYSHMTRVKNATETLYIAGMIAPGDTFDAQCTGAFAQIETALKSAGAGWGNVAQFTTYLVHSQDIAKFMAWRLREFPKMFPDGKYPPNTLLVVDRLVQEQFLVEVQTIAAL